MTILEIMQAIAKKEGVVNLTISRATIAEDGFKVSIIRYDSDKWPSAKSQSVEQAIRDVASQIGISEKRRMPGT